MQTVTKHSASRRGFPVCHETARIQTNRPKSISSVTHRHCDFRERSRKRRGWRCERKNKQGGSRRVANTLVFLRPFENEPLGDRGSLLLRNINPPLIDSLEGYLLYSVNHLAFCPRSSGMWDVQEKKEKEKKEKENRRVNERI